MRERKEKTEVNQGDQAGSEGAKEKEWRSKERTRETEMKEGQETG